MNRYPKKVKQKLVIRKGLFENEFLGELFCYYLKYKKHLQLEEFEKIAWKSVNSSECHTLKLPFNPHQIHEKLGKTFFHVNFQPSNDNPLSLPFPSLWTREKFTFIFQSEIQQPFFCFEFSQLPKKTQRKMFDCFLLFSLKIQHTSSWFWEGLRKKRINLIFYVSRQKSFFYFAYYLNLLLK